jgi:hypothetical protein
MTTTFDEYHSAAARLLGLADFPLPLPEWDKNYPHNVGLLSDAQESALAAQVINHTSGMSVEEWRRLNMEQRLPWMQLAVKKAYADSTTGNLVGAEVLDSLAERAHAGTPIVEADEVTKWPNGLLEELVADGTLRSIRNAKSIACDACGRDHIEAVEYVDSPPGTGLRAYISCPECGRVPVSLTRLRRWSIDLEKISGSKDKHAMFTGSSDVRKNVTHSVSYTTEFLPTPSADDPKGLRDAADYCRAQSAKFGDARAKWWWIQARVFDASAAEAEAKVRTTGPNEPPSPTVDEPLNERAQDVLVAMLESGALDSDTRKSTEDIAAKALSQHADANALKSVMSDLKTREYVRSKTGRGGGCWLTEKGRLRAEKLRNR